MSSEKSADRDLIGSPTYDRGGRYFGHLIMEQARHAGHLT